MGNKLLPLDKCIEIVNAAIENKEINFVFLEDAPKLVKLLSSGEYCAYKNTVYVPSIHLKLSTSANESDRAVATAKLLPWIMAIKDGKTSSLYQMRKLLTDYKLRSFYFMYEYVFLVASENPYADTIFGGFVCSRKGWLGKRYPTEQIIDYLQTLL
jgi:hypothetical protein